jgi:diadenosine tetraphosphatase ApaH/serine/threonine PP2A family protein phosphatase
MNIECCFCGSLCLLEWADDEVTESRPLFCPFCGEPLEEDEDDSDEDEGLNYLERIFDEGRPDEEE